MIKHPDNTFNVGDKCLYSYIRDRDCVNSTQCIVEIVELHDNLLTAKVKFLQILLDDSGNGLFDYLYRENKTMNVSLCYLTKM